MRLKGNPVDCANSRSNSQCDPSLKFPWRTFCSDTMTLDECIVYLYVMGYNLMRIVYSLNHYTTTYVATSTAYRTTKRGHATHDVAPMNGTQPVSNVPTSDAPSSQISVLIEPGEAGSGIPMVQLDSSAVPRPTELPTADVDDRIRRYLQRPCLTCAKMGKVCLTRAEYKRRLDVLIPQYRRLREEYKPLRAAFSQMANIPKGLKGDESICYMLRFQETKEFQDCRAFLLRTGYLTVKKETQELCFLARNWSSWSKLLKHIKYDKLNAQAYSASLLYTLKPPSTIPISIIGNQRLLRIESESFRCFLLSSTVHISYHGFDVRKVTTCETCPDTTTTADSLLHSAVPSNRSFNLKDNLSDYIENSHPFLTSNFESVQRPPKTVYSSMDPASNDTTRSRRTANAFERQQPSGERSVQSQTWTCDMCARANHICLTREEYRRQLETDLIPKFIRLRNQYNPLREAVDRLIADDIPRACCGNSERLDQAQYKRILFKYKDTKEVKDIQHFLRHSEYLKIKKMMTWRLCERARQCKNRYVSPSDPFEYRVAYGLVVSNDDA
ncbi:hypothetical protein ABKN59_010083 [Abortiporus biennis]